MIKSMIAKELRESAGIVALGLLGLIYMLSSLTGFPLTPFHSPRIYHYPFVRDSLGFSFWMVAGGLAIALGLKQTAWELGRDTFYFLLHRPMSRKQIFGIKLAVGCLLTFAVAGAMLLLYAWWAITPGKFPAPFEWSMTFPAWRMLVAVPVVYFGAFLSGIRPAAWFGSRLVPLLSSFVAAGVVSLAPSLWLAIVESLAISSLYLAAIFHYVQHRDF